jgi:FkbM family methyltransferase
VNWSAISKEKPLGRLMRLPLRLVPSGAVVRIMQGSLRGCRWIAGSSFHGCWLGSYEYDKRILFETMVSEGFTVFDVGAHVGFYTLLASTAVGAEGQVVAFEPVPRNLSYLRRHLQLNHIENVTVVEAAVSDTPGIAQFDQGQDSHVGHISSQGALQVRAVTLDALIATGEVPRPDCIKVDVEGAELAVLRGAEGTLWRTHPILFVATHGRANHAECIGYLESLEYGVCCIGTPPSDLHGELLAVWRPDEGSP